MESGRSDLARAAVEVSAVYPDLEASIVDSDHNQAAVTETTSAWTGQKKTKTQSAPTSGEHSSRRIVGRQEQERWEWYRFLKWNREGNPCERGEIDGLDWDDDKLEKEIDGCLRRLKDNPLVYRGGTVDGESLTILDEEQHTLLHRRLALYRLRAYKEKYQDMDDERLSTLFPPDDLDEKDYFRDLELGFEWYFDRAYCHYAHFQDYQRLVLRNNVEWAEDWEFYRSTCSTLEGDQEYVQFWENLSSKTRLIQWYITRTTCDWESRTERLFYYHTLKIAAVHPNVYKTLIETGWEEFRRSLHIDFIWSLPYADFFFEMWKLLARQKLSFRDALKRVYSDGKYPFVFVVKEFELLEEWYKPFLVRIGEKEADEARGLIMDRVTERGRKPKTYYDYAKKKLGIAEKIGLIP